MAQRPLARRDRKPGAVREFFTGVSFIGRGFAAWRYAPGTMFAGWIPAMLVLAGFVALFVTLGISIDGISAAITPFANDWDEPYRTGLRFIASFALLAGALLIIVNVFTSVTLIVGAWFYDRIWVQVEERFGTVPEQSSGFWRGVLGDIGEGLKLLFPTLLLGLAVLLLGLIPLLGSAVAVVLGAFVGGWFLTLDLTGQALGARGLSLRERRHAIRGRRALTLGFGVATYLLFLIPLGAVLVMPAAVAGATLLSRRVLGESEVPVSAGGRTAS